MWSIFLWKTNYVFCNHAFCDVKYFYFLLSKYSLISGKGPLGGSTLKLLELTSVSRFFAYSKNTDFRLVIVTNLPQTRLTKSQQTFLLFLSWMSLIILIGVLLKWYAQICKWWKSHHVLPSKRSLAWISKISEFWLSREKDTAILTLPIPVSHSFHLHWKLEKRECIHR